MIRTAPRYLWPLYCATLLYSTPVALPEVATRAIVQPVGIAALPYIAGARVLYQGYAGGNFRLYLYDIASQQRSELRDNRTNYLYPLDFGTEHAAWITYASSTFNGGIGGLLRTTGPMPVIPINVEYRIDMIDIASKTTRTVSTTGAYKEFVAADALSIIWTDYTHSTTSDTFPEIYRYTHAGGEVSRISTHVSYKADIDVQGDVVVWQDYRNAGGGNNADIYARILSSGEEREVCTNPAYQAQPSVHGNRVVWQDYRTPGTGGNNADIYLLDLGTGTETAISTHPAFQAHPRISERFVVWQDYRHVTSTDPENTAIYLYDLSTGTEHALSTQNGYLGPPAVEGNLVVWYNYDTDAIYLATIGATGTDTPRTRPVHLSRDQEPRAGLSFTVRSFPAHDLKGRATAAGVQSGASGYYLAR